MKPKASRQGRERDSRALVPMLWNDRPNRCFPVVARVDFLDGSRGFNDADALRAAEGTTGGNLPVVDIVIRAASTRSDHTGQICVLLHRLPAWFVMPPSMT